MFGHIYRRTTSDGSPGRWHAVIDLPPGPGGRRRQKTTTHDTKRKAQAWLATTSQEIRTDTLADDTITVAVYLEQWLDGKKGLRPSTLVDYRRHIHQVFIPGLGHLKLAELRPRHITEVLDRLQKAQTTCRAPVTAQTLRRVLATLNSALNTAVKRGVIHRNPAATVELPKPDRYHPSVWSKEEADRFLTATQNDPLGLLLRVMLLTGIRRGEAIGLHWGDLDLAQGSIRIQRAVTLVDGELVIGPPKTDAGRRTLWLDPTTTDLLHRHQRRAILAHDFNSTPVFEDTYVFRSRDSVIHPAHLSRRFTTLTRQAQAPLIRLHDLRHTSASLGLAAGEPLLQVSRRLGHSSITVTADVYTHVTPGAAKQAATALSTTITGS